jgi:hypothetical protein
VGDVQVEPVGGDSNLYARFGLLAPNGKITFIVRFSSPGQSVFFFADPTIETSINAGIMNVLQSMLLAISPYLPRGSNPVLAIQDFQIIVEAFAQMPHLRGAVDALFQSPPDLIEFARQLIAFLGSETETDIFIDLLKDLGINVTKAILGTIVALPETILRIMDTIITALFGEPAGSIIFFAQ